VGLLSILSALSGKTNTDAVRRILHTTAPKELVDRGVDANIAGSHSLTSKLLKRAKSLGSALLELSAKDVLVNVHGIFAADCLRSLHHF